MMMKHGSLREIDEAIHYFNANLKRHTEMSVQFGQDIDMPYSEEGIKIALETTAKSERSPIKIELSSYALYGFDRGGLPTLRMAPTILDIRDYFARSLLKRPEYAVLNLDVRIKENKEKKSSETPEDRLLRKIFETEQNKVFFAYYSVGYERTLKIELPEKPNKITERYRKSIENLTAGKNLQKAIDLAFRIYEEVPNEENNEPPSTDLKPI